DFLADLREGQRSERSEFGRLQDHRISGSESGRDFPGEHQQRKIPGNDLADNAARDVTGKFLRDQLSPAGVMIEMPCDQRNIDVAALANRFAVVECFQHCEAARMFLNLASQSIQKTGAGMRRERLPTRKSSTCSADGSVNVSRRSLCNFREVLARGR